MGEETVGDGSEETVERPTSQFQPGPEIELVEAEAVKEQDMDKKSTIVFPPPCMWFNAYAASGRPEMFAYIGFNCLVIANVGGGSSAGAFSHSGTSSETGEESSWPSFTLIGQQAKFTCVSMSQQDLDHLAYKNSPTVTGDASGLVKIWNIQDKSCVVYHDSHSEAKAVTAVEWSVRNPHLIYSIDAEGGMTIWNVKENFLKKMKLETTSHLSCIAVSPHEDHIVAVGCLPGNILILDTTAEIVTLHKMHHDEELVSLSWVPFEGWNCVDLKSHHSSPLLISAVYTCKEPSIRVWDRTGNDVTIFTLAEDKEDVQPPVPNSRAVQSSRKPFKSFVPIGWLKQPGTDEVRLYSTFKNAIVTWENSLGYRPVHTIHNIGSIYCLIQTGDILWSFGLESIIVGWNLRLNQKHLVIPTARGICCAQSSPVVRTQVAFGGADGILKVFNMRDGYPSTGAYNVPMLTAKIDARVTSVAWHPVRDNLIGMGTNDGILGIYEYRENNRYVKLFERRAPGTVYAISWGPPSYTREFETKHEINQESKKDAKEEHGSEKSRPLSMYICAGDKVFMMNPSKTSNALVNIGHILRTSNPASEDRGSYKITEIRWCPDQIFLCLGFSDGRIDIFKPPYLELRLTIRCHNKAIQSLEWRPYDFGPNTDSLSKWLASSSNDGTIRLYNLASLYSVQEGAVVHETIHSSACTLKDHSVRVISLAWSPFDPKLLLSVSYDQSAIVWNIIEGTRVARYFGHTQRLVACLFHPSDPFKVVTLSDELMSDFPMHIWDYRNHPFRDISAQIITKVKSRVQAIKVEREQKEMEPSRLEKFIPVTGVQAGSIHVGDANELEIQTESARTSKTYQSCSATTDQNSVSPLSESLLPNDSSFQETALLHLADYYSQPGKSTNAEGSLKKIGLICGLENKEDFNELIIQPSVDNHLSNNSWHAALQLSLWTGNHEALIERALKTEEITQTTVNIVLTNSYRQDLRLRVIDIYIKNLISAGDIFNAVTYLLIIGRDEEAVELYLKKNLFHCAMGLTISRLKGKAQETFMNKIFTDWTSFFIEKENFFEALHMYCAKGQLVEALKVIDSWNMPEAWKLGITLANKVEKNEYGNVFGIKFIQWSLSKGNYQECFNLVKEFEYLKWLLPIVLAHQRLVLKLNASINGNNLELEGTVAELVVDLNARQFFPDMYNISKQNIASYLKLVIPQSREEALLVIAKFLTLIILEGVAAGNGSKEYSKNLLEKSALIARNWFKEVGELDGLIPCINSVESPSDSGIENVEHFNEVEQLEKMATKLSQCVIKEKIKLQDHEVLNALLEDF